MGCSCPRFVVCWVFIAVTGHCGSGSLWWCIAAAMHYCNSEPLWLCAWPSGWGCASSPANDLSVHVIPAVVAHTAPEPVMAHLHPSLAILVAIDQLHTTLHVTCTAALVACLLDSCCGIAYMS